jgi:hypothetical protein
MKAIDIRAVLAYTTDATEAAEDREAAWAIRA